MGDTVEKIDVLKLLDEVVRRTDAAMPTPFMLRGESTMHPAKHVDYGWSIRQARAAVAEFIEAASVLIGEWDRQDHGGKFDPMPGKDWAVAEARFRTALSAVTNHGA